MTSRNPTTWDQYERGGLSRTGSNSSLGNRSVQFEHESLLGRSADSSQDNRPLLRRRRSSITHRLTALTDIGGVNSIRSFTRSWQRAAGFTEVIPQRPSFVFAPDQAPIGGLDGGDVGPYDRGDLEASSEPGSVRQSLLRQHLEAEAAPGEESPEPSASHAPFQQPGLDFREREQKALENELTPAFRVGSHSSASGGSIFAIPPHLSTPSLVGSYGSAIDYGTIPSDASGASMAQAAALWRQQQEAGGNVPDGEIEPILVKEVEQDGKIVLAVEGQSTLPQTVFNSTNVLIGIGLLSLPVGVKYAGWLCGMIFLSLSAAVTAWTAKLLAKCMDLDPSLITFSDLAFISFGRNARIATSVLFTLELLAACVALLVIFADSLDLLLPGLLSVTGWKIVCAIILVPLNFLPLRLLSFTSVIGIFSCFSIVLILLIDGFIKPTSPGSLLQPAKTYLFPANWLTLPLSFGLLMSPWGGHGVFPNIYRDMRHPYKYTRALAITFSLTYLLDAVTAVAGLLMFGDEVRDEITSNILMESSYPRTLTLLMCLFIGIIPLTKVPLNARPIVATAEVLLGLHQQTVAENPGLVGRTMSFRGAMKIVIRVSVILCFLVISIVFPAFDSIMAFMGSALCFTICVTLPLAFYLKLFGHEIPVRERIFAGSVMVLSFVLSIVGTVWAFLPKSLIGAEPPEPS
ncbi:Amino acid transporter transmembrane domain-containing protein [Madurella fahalii]|uniref:Amino acid transporter transmembrane domain-containing protein n=1 Tax=Madurella fahalii TaxID=1157608 RepID=A0ABQ0GS86_9PEZI